MVWILCQLFTVGMVFIFPVAFLWRPLMDTYNHEYFTRPHVLEYYHGNGGLLWTSFVSFNSVISLVYRYYYDYYTTTDIVDWSICNTLHSSEQTDGYRS